MAGISDARLERSQSKCSKTCLFFYTFAFTDAAKQTQPHTSMLFTMHSSPVLFFTDPTT